MKKSKQDDVNDFANGEMANDELLNDDGLEDENVTSDIADDDQFDSFNQDDFSDLDQFNENEDQSDIVAGDMNDDLSTEFHGADPDLPSNENTDISSKKSLIELLKENWLYATIGLVVIIVAIYLVMDLFSTPTTTPAAPAQQPAGFNSVPQNTQSNATETQPTTSTTDTTSTSATTDTTTASITPAIPTNTEVNLSSTQLNQLLDGMTKIVEANNQKISQEITQSTQADSDAKLKALETNVVILSSNLNQLNQTLGNLETKLNNTQTQLATLLASETATEEHLTLRAVVPGRAWLVDSKGHTISVTEGTSVGVFGTVTNIDTADNSVTTSSGYVFK